MIRSALLWSIAVVFTCPPAFAGPQAMLSKDRLTSFISPASAARAQPPAGKKAGHGVADTFATAYKNGLYWCCSGGTIAGQNSPLGESVEQGEPFTPRATGNATKITVGAAYSSGTNSITISLYSDDNNAPGSVIASGTVENLPDFGTCCAIVSVRFPATKLIKGTQYWVVLSAPDDGWESWSFSEIDQVHDQPFAINQGGAGWQVHTSNVSFAMDVK
jgi:hypothetical protein